MAKTLVPLAVDIAIPLSIYYVLRDGFGTSLVMSLALSSVLPAVRSIVEFARSRKIEALAILMVLVNVAGIAISFTTGDARLMMAKDSVVSSVIGVAILFSVWRRKPIMSAGLKPYLTKGDPEKLARFEALQASSASFRTLELRYSTIWGCALLADCAARIIGAYTLPITTMVWLSTCMVIGAIVIAVVVGGGAAAEPMTWMLTNEKVTADA